MSGKVLTREELLRAGAQNPGCVPTWDSVFATDAELRGKVEERNRELREIAAGTKTLVRCGCLGCLTDDCDHWGVDCKLKDYTLCFIGRTVDVLKERVK